MRIDSAKRFGEFVWEQKPLQNMAFNIFNCNIEQQIGHYDMHLELKKLYEDNIQLLKEKIEFPEKEIQRLKNS